MNPENKSNFPSKSNKERTKVGAYNLLKNCINLKQNQTVLIVGEDFEGCHFDSKIVDLVAEHVYDLGGVVTKIITGKISDHDVFPDDVNQAMREHDHIIFFSRLGDMVRFSDTTGSGTKTMCYTLNEEYFADEFCQIPFDLMSSIHDQLLNIIHKASRYTITCPKGTDLEGVLTPASNENEKSNSITDFTVTLFPVMIFPPVNAMRTTGTLVFEKCLLSTSTTLYDDSVLVLEEPVIATIEEGILTGFQGNPTDIEKVEAQYDMVGNFTSGNHRAVNSWHTGINPKTTYLEPHLDDIERWGTVTYGSPRYTHFHTCGDAPGLISTVLFDATISFDDQIIWKAGEFVFLKTPEIQKLILESGVDQNLLNMQWNLGI